MPYDSAQPTWVDHSPNPEAETTPEYFFGENYVVVIQPGTVAILFVDNHRNAYLNSYNERTGELSIHGQLFFGEAGLEIRNYSSSNGEPLQQGITTAEGVKHLKSFLVRDVLGHNQAEKELEAILTANYQKIRTTGARGRLHTGRDRLLNNPGVTKYFRDKEPTS